VVVLAGETAWLPLVAVLAVHSALQLVTLLALHTSTLVSPGLRKCWSVVRATTGGEVDTLTVVLALAEPPEPVHVIVYVVVLAGDTAWLPLVAVLAVQLALQLVMLLEFQTKTLISPGLRKCWSVVRLTTGGELDTLTVVLAPAVPPAPVHVIV